MCGHVGSHLQRLVHGSAGHSLGAPAGKLAQSRFCSCSSALTSTMVTGRAHSTEYEPTSGRSCHADTTRAACGQRTSAYGTSLGAHGTSRPGEQWIGDSQDPGHPCRCAWRQIQDGVAGKDHPVWAHQGALPVAGPLARCGRQHWRSQRVLAEEGAVGRQVCFPALSSYDPFTPSSLQASWL